MSNIVIRNIVGNGPFSIPTTDKDVKALDSAIRSVLDSIPGFRYLECKGDTYNQENIPAEIFATISSFSYYGSIIPSTSIVRNELQAAFLSNINITSIGEIEIRLIQEGGFYEQYPIIDRVDDIRADVYFFDNIPPSAQIEVYKYTSQWTGKGKRYTSRGKRYRPERLLPLGAIDISLSQYIKVKRRNHFRFAFRWPVLDNSGGPGIRGPLSDLSISTATPKEREQGSLLVINPAPCSFHH